MAAMRPRGLMRIHHQVLGFGPLRGQPPHVPGLPTLSSGLRCFFECLFWALALRGENAAAGRGLIDHQVVKPVVSACYDRTAMGRHPL